MVQRQQNSCDPLNPCRSGRRISKHSVSTVAVGTRRCARRRPRGPLPHPVDTRPARPARDACLGNPIPWGYRGIGPISRRAASSVDTRKQRLPLPPVLITERFRGGKKPQTPPLSARARAVCPVSDAADVIPVDAFRLDRPAPSREGCRRTRRKREKKTFKLQPSQQALCRVSAVWFRQVRSQFRAAQESPSLVNSLRERVSEKLYCRRGILPAKVEPSVRGTCGLWCHCDLCRSA